MEKPDVNEYKCSEAFLRFKKARAKAKLIELNILGLKNPIKLHYCLLLLKNIYGKKN